MPKSDHLKYYYYCTFLSKYSKAKCRYGESKTPNFGVLKCIQITRENKDTNNLAPKKRYQEAAYAENF